MAKTDLDKLVPEANAASRDGEIVARSLNGLSDSIANEIGSNEDDHLKLQMARYEANLDNYQTTGAGVYAEIEAKNKMIRDKQSSLTKRIAVMESVRPMLKALDKMNNDKAVAAAGGKGLEPEQTLGHLKAIIAAADASAAKLSQVAPEAAERIKQKQMEIAAFSHRLNDLIKRFNRDRTAVHLSTI